MIDMGANNLNNKPISNSIMKNLILLIFLMLFLDRVSLFNRMVKDLNNKEEIENMKGIKDNSLVDLIYKGFYHYYLFY